LQAEIQRVWSQNFQVYGARKVWRQLRRESYDVACCTVEWLMRRKGIQGEIRGARCRTTAPAAQAACPADRVKRQFNAQRPNQLWVANFAYIETWSGFVYTAFIIDVFGNRMVGWRTAGSIRTDLVLDALEQALYARGAEDGLIHHS
jgi:transposase InsO family protein